MESVKLAVLKSLFYENCWDSWRGGMQQKATAVDSYSRRQVGCEHKLGAQHFCVDAGL